MTESCNVLIHINLRLTRSALPLGVSLVRGWLAAVQDRQSWTSWTTVGWRTSSCPHRCSASARSRRSVQSNSGQDHQPLRPRAGAGERRRTGCDVRDGCRGARRGSPGREVPVREWGRNHRAGHRNRPAAGRHRRGTARKIGGYGAILAGAHGAASRPPPGPLPALRPTGDRHHPAGGVPESGMPEHWSSSPSTTETMVQKQAARLRPGTLQDRRARIARGVDRLLAPWVEGQG